MSSKFNLKEHTSGKCFDRNDYKIFIWSMVTYIMDMNELWVRAKVTDKRGRQGKPKASQCVHFNWLGCDIGWGREQWSDESEKEIKRDMRINLAVWGFIVIENKQEEVVGGGLLPLYGVPSINTDMLEFRIGCPDSEFIAITSLWPWYCSLSLLGLSVKILVEGSGLERPKEIHYFVLCLYLLSIT